MGRCNLPSFILQHIRVRALQHAWRSTTETRRMFAQIGASSAGFNPDELHLFVRNELVKRSDRIRAAAHAGNYRVRQASSLLENLLARFASNAAVKVAHHHWIRMSSQNGTQQIVGATDVGYPVTHCFVYRIFECAGTGAHRPYFCSEQTHAEDVQFLAPHILTAHVNDAFEAEQRTNSCGSDAVLARAGFRNDAPLTHTSREQSLPETVVDLVCAGMQQIFTLQKNPSAT